MADSNERRSYRAYDPHARFGGSGDTQPDPAANDPLAELARLIGQSDPFADLDRRSGAAEEAHGTYRAAPPPTQDWPLEQAPISSSEAYPSQAATDPYAAAMAMPLGGAPQGHPEHYAEGTYTPYPEQAPLHPDHAREYPPEAYEQDYDGYYGDDGQPLDEAEYYAQQQQQQKRSRRLAAVVAILSLAVVGGAGAYGYRTFFAEAHRNSVPPVIKADTTPAKMIPATQAGDSASNKLIYDRVGERNQAERVVPREENPVDIKTATVSPRPRTVYPRPQAGTPTPPSATIPVAGRSANGQVLAVASVPSVGQGSGAILPSAKKVRTVTIRPDMTIVPDTAAGRADPAPPSPRAAEAAPAPRQASPPPPDPAPTEVTRSVAAAPPPAPAPPQPARSAPPPRQSPSAPLSLSPSEAAPAPAPAPRTPPRPAQQQQPLSLASVPPASSARAQPAAPTGSAKFAVQVSSQRSEAEASAAYRTLQLRYPNVLGGRSSFVRRADLGSRGIYYRTMVGPFATAEEAAQLCTSLKAAGGQCILHRN
jgi:hypothetical protein